VSDVGEFDLVLGHPEIKNAKRNYKYIEIRALSPCLSPDSGLHESVSYCFHTLDLRDNLSKILAGFHEDCIRRKIRRAEREKLSCETGTSEYLVRQFYRLLVRTRKRHHLLPQPLAWIKNLVQCIGDKVQIRIAKKGDVPIAGLLSLRHRETVIYKYGCSDERFHNLGGVPFLFWNLIQDSKHGGAQKLDFGRSDWSQQSLILFKDRFGTSRRPLSYFRRSSASQSSKPFPITPMIQRWIAHFPDAVLSAAGRITYRHVG